jgi:hypothetical protein
VRLVLGGAEGRLDAAFPRRSLMRRLWPFFDFRPPQADSLFRFRFCLSPSVFICVHLWLLFSSLFGFRSSAL